MSDTPAEAAPKTAALISKFFFDGSGPKMTATEKMAELRALTPEDKQQLAKGIADGTLTY